MTPPAGSYAVIFASKQANLDAQSKAAYLETASRMFELAASMPGYLGVETAHQANGNGITISYWQSEAAIKAWRDNVEHAEARRRGKAHWYQSYRIQVVRIERSYDWTSNKA